jgi:superfamily I DNA/RNA helicase
LKSQIKDEGEIKHFHFAAYDDEIRGVLEQVDALKRQDKEAVWSDFAILARTNEVANNFSQALAQTQIPYRFVASRAFIQVGGARYFGLFAVA